MQNPEPNVYKYFVSVTVDNLMNNINTLEEHNLTLDVVTNCNQDLSEAWTKGPATGDIAQGIKDVQDKSMTIDAFVKKYLSAGSANIADFSEATGSLLMNLLANNYDPKGTGPLDMNVINSFNSIVQSTANNEEQLGQNLSKTEGSVVQQDASAQQPLADIGNSIEGIFGNIASLVQQIYS